MDMDLTAAVTFLSTHARILERRRMQLHRLASQQQPDGGWEVTYASFSPAGALEWRGYTTVQSVTVLRNGRL